MSDSSQRSEPEPFSPPYVYVKELIKITQKMAPEASRSQWNDFALISRKIELSHQHYLSKAYNSTKAIPVLQGQTEKMEKEILKLQESLYSMAISHNDMRKELTASQNTNKSLNDEITKLQKQVIHSQAFEDEMQKLSFFNEESIAELKEDMAWMKLKVEEFGKAEANAD